MTSPPVAAFAREKELDLLQTDNINRSPEITSLLDKGDIDVVVVLAFAQFLGNAILKGPRLGAFNIHTSLLPRYRGAAPIQYAIWNGDKTTGVSIQKMVKKMDAGDIVYSHEVNISPLDTSGSLFEKMKWECVKAVEKFIFQLIDESWVPQAQDESQVTFAPSLKKEDGCLSFKKNTAEEISNQVRAMHPWPGTYTWLNGKRLKVLKVMVDETGKLEPGELSVRQGFLQVGTRKGTLQLEQVQMEGKKVCTGIELINGLKNTISCFQLTQGTCSQ